MKLEEKIDANINYITALQEIQTISGKAKYWRDKYTNLSHWTVLIAILLLASIIGHLN